MEIIEDGRLGVRSDGSIAFVSRTPAERERHAAECALPRAVRIAYDALGSTSRPHTS